MDINIEEIPNHFLSFAWDNLDVKSRLKLLEAYPKTVWLFGAGASHHYCLNAYGINIPLAKGFFQALNDLPSSKGFHALIGPLISYLYHYRGINPSKAYEFEENIEEFMTSIETELLKIKNQKFGSNDLSPNEFERLFVLSQVYNNMIFLFTNVINESQNGPVSPIITDLLKFCSPNDTFISLNWDTLLDKALASTGYWNPNTGYNLNFTAIFDGIWKAEICSSKLKDGWELIKLHGSTNWLVPYTAIHLTTADYQSIISEGSKVFLYWQSTLPYETFNGRWRGGYEATCYGYYPPNIPFEYFSTKSLTLPKGQVMVTTQFKIFTPFKEPGEKGIPSSPLIITPVKQKRYELYFETIEKLWKRAEDKLLNADRLVIVGYSFPVTDIRTINLIKDVLKKRKKEIDLILIDPSAIDIKTKIESDFNDNVRSIQTYSLKLEDYVINLWDNAHLLIKKAIHESVNVKDWILRIFQMSDGYPYNKF